MGRRSTGLAWRRAPPVRSILSCGQRGLHAAPGRSQAEQGGGRRVAGADQNKAKGAIALTVDGRGSTSSRLRAVRRTRRRLRRESLALWARRFGGARFSLPACAVGWQDLRRIWGAVDAPTSARCHRRYGGRPIVSDDSAGENWPDRRKGLCGSWPGAPSLLAWMGGRA